MFVPHSSKNGVSGLLKDYLKQWKLADKKATKQQSCVGLTLCDKDIFCSTEQTLPATTTRLGTFIYSIFYDKERDEEDSEEEVDEESEEEEVLARFSGQRIIQARHSPPIWVSSPTQRTDLKQRRLNARRSPQRTIIESGFSGNFKMAFELNRKKIRNM